MNIFGKLTGLVVGFFFFGPLGLIIGLALGHVFDITIDRTRSARYTNGQTENLLPVLFALFGRIAGYGKSFSQGQALFIQTVVLPRLGLAPWDHNLAIQSFREALEDTFNENDVSILASVRSLAQDIYENFFLDRRTLLWIHATCRQLAALGTVRLGLIDLLDSISKEFCIFDETGTSGFDQRNSGFGEEETYKSKWSSFNPGTEAGPEAYGALGLAPTASVEEIKKAYRDLVQKYHPDRLQHLAENEIEKKRGSEKFLLIQHAYERIRKDRHF